MRQSYTEGPRAPREEWIDRAARRRGASVEKTTFTSKLLGTTRDVWVYTPPGYDSLARRGNGLPLLLTFDGGEYVSSIPAPTILDNLLAARRIAPMIGVFVGSPEGQRDAESARMRATSSSRDGAAPMDTREAPARAITARERRRGVEPRRVGGGVRRVPASRAVRQRALAVGGVHVRGARWRSSEALTREIEASPRRDVAFYLEAGIYEQVRLENGVDLLTSNRRLRDVLRAKGYRLTYDEFAGGHSDLNWRSGFARGLVALVGQ